MPGPGKAEAKYSGLQMTSDCEKESLASEKMEIAKEKKEAEVGEEL